MKSGATIRIVGVLFLLLTSALGPVAAPLSAQESEHTLFLPSVLGVAGEETAVGAGAAPNLEQVIVVMRDTVDNPGTVASELARRHNGNVGFVYQHALKGASMSVPAPAIAGIQHDGPAGANGQKVTVSQYILSKETQSDQQFLDFD